MKTLAKQGRPCSPILTFAPMVIVSRHGAQLAFLGIFCGFARARLERNHDLRNQQVAIRDTMLGAEPRNLLICPHVVSDQDRKNSLLRTTAIHSCTAFARPDEGRYLTGSYD